MTRCSSFHRAIAVAVTGAALCVQPAGAAAPVSGSITINGQKVALTKAYVDESANDLIVVLASKEVPRDAIPFVGEEVARTNTLHGVVFTVSRADRALARGFGGVFYPGEEMGFSGLREGTVTLELSRLDATGIEGRVFTPAPVDGYEMKYTFEASFALPLGAAAPAPPPVVVKVSGDTSPPAKAYADYYRVVFSGDAAKLTPFLAGEQRAQFEAADPEERGMLLEMLKMHPAEIRVGKPSVKGSTATLSVEGLNETSEKSTAEVTMVLEGGAWRLLKESWHTTNK